MTSPYLTTAEVAERLRLSASTVRTLCRTGKLATHRFSRRVVISEADLQVFVEASHQNARMIQK
jgi:excisionase family DNA binding protein